MNIRSDWHIHSDFSYDSKLPLQQIIDKGYECGFIKLALCNQDSRRRLILN